mgnify:CR=1 FL=1
MNQNLDRLLAGLAERGERVVELQSALTACKALGPDNGGRGELDKVRRITDWLTARKRYVNAASRSRGEPSREEKLNVRLIPAAVVPVLVLQPMTELSEPFSTRKP